MHSRAAAARHGERLDMQGFSPRFDPTSPTTGDGFAGLRTVANAPQSHAADGGGSAPNRSDGIPQPGYSANASPSYSPDVGRPLLHHHSVHAGRFGVRAAGSRAFEGAWAGVVLRFCGAVCTRGVPGRLWATVA
jgi:hypothetical protein